jgi:hypothetical protein
MKYRFTSDRSLGGTECRVPAHPEGKRAPVWPLNTAGNVRMSLFQIARFIERAYGAGGAARYRKAEKGGGANAVRVALYWVPSLLGYRVAKTLFFYR